MVRKRKQNVPPADDMPEKERRNFRTRLLADFWTERIRAAREVKETYTNNAAEVLDYFKSKHDRLYEEAGENFHDFTAGFAVSVPKLAQMKNSLGPRLYVAEPRRTVIPRSQDGVMIGLAKTLGAYLTYTASEVDFGKAVRNGVDDGLMAGRMILRQTWDDVRKIVIPAFLDSMDLLFDPDFHRIEDASWIAIRHREPLWALKRRFPAKQRWRLKNLEDSTHAGVIGNDTDADQDEGNEELNTEKKRYSQTVVEWWEVLSRMGCGFRGSSLEDQARHYDDEKDYVRLEVVLGHDCVLKEGEWDVPLYLDRMFPISYEDFVETPRSHWPESPGGQVLSLQKGIDLLTSLRMTSCKNRDRVVVFLHKAVAGQVQTTLQKGSSADCIPVDVPQGMSLDMVMKVADFGAGSVESAAEREFLLKEMEVTLGTTSMITGGQDPQAQDRSATATQLRNAAAEIRTADLETKVANLMKQSARNEALMVRLFLKEDEVAPFVKPWDLNLFYVKVELPGSAVVAVRPPHFGEGEEPDDAALTLADVSPSAATYFSTPEGAAQAALDLWNDLLQAIDPRLVELRDAIIAMNNGVVPPPESGQLPMGISIDLVTAERVWRDTAGLKPEELMRELSYKIEAGKGVKFDKQAERDYAANAVQTVLPIMLQLGDYQGANAILAMRDDAFEVPPDKRTRLTPPPMPAPGEGEAPEKKGKSKSSKKPKKGE